MPTTGDFQKELDSIFAFAEEKLLMAIVNKSGDLYRLPISEDIMSAYLDCLPLMPLLWGVSRQSKVN